MNPNSSKVTVRRLESIYLEFCAQVSQLEIVHVQM